MRLQSVVSVVEKREDTMEIGVGVGKKVTDSETLFNKELLDFVWCNAQVESWLPYDFRLRLKSMRTGNIIGTPYSGRSII